MFNFEPIDRNPTVAIWAAEDDGYGGIVATDRVLWQGPLRDLEDRNGQAYAILYSDQAAVLSVIKLAPGHTRPLNGYRI